MTGKGWIGACLLAASCIVTTSLAGWSSDQVLSQRCADVALVLAIDGSSSIDAAEYRFQQEAIVAALRDPGVLNAMASAGAVSVAAVFWGDPNRPVQETEPVVIRSASDAERLAREIESLPRVVLGNTGLSTGLAAALNKLAAMGCALRSVINVSGDGRGTILDRRNAPPLRLKDVRELARSRNVTINALVISNEEPHLFHYYEKEVITGPDAFVMEIGAFEDYAMALRRKLIREIAATVISLAD